MKRYVLLALFLVAVVVLAGGFPALGTRLVGAAPGVIASQEAPAPVLTSDPLPTNGVVAAFHATLEEVYEQVSPSVVTIQVISQSRNPLGIFPFGQDMPRSQSGIGSGFVWDKEGHIVTNNHVIDGATKITVVFSDDSTAAAKVVGTDPQTDLAVLKVDVPAAKLRPVRMGDSSKLKVGALAIAIGNPFGQQNTMTTGIISALGRSMPADFNAIGPTFSIPEIIQTDAPINPGNSGGVLLNAQGEVIGVTYAIESPSQSSAGIGFAIPSQLVAKIVPSLISKGSYEHPYLGISGTSLTAEVAKAMGLSEEQRGALVGAVTAGGPAEKAGLRGSTSRVTIDGAPVDVGGDVIVAIDGKAINRFEDLVSYLAMSTRVGQEITLTVLRDGKEIAVKATVGARPTTVAQNAPVRDMPQTRPFQRQPTPTPSVPQQSVPATGASLGIRGMTLTADLAKAMNLPAAQQGVLVVDVIAGTPAERAGLRGSSQSVEINGQSVKVGGDVITAVDGQAVTGMTALQRFLAGAKADQKVTLTVLRDGKEVKLTVTLAAAGAATR